MSDLQIVLIVIGGIIIAGVLVYNWWQEKRFHEQVGESFSNIKSDALLDEPSFTQPLLTEPSLDVNMYDAKNDFGHEDFSIDHNVINEASALSAEPALGNADFHHGVYAEPAPISEHAAHESMIAEAGVAADVPGKPFSEAIPVNHEGIKAIFEDAFSKAPNQINNQELLSEGYVQRHADDAVTESSAFSLPAMLDAQIDLIGLLHLTAEMPVEAVFGALKDDFTGYDKPVFVHVQTPDSKWMLLSDMSSKPEFADLKVTKITCSLQLADRAGAVPRSVINRFQLAVESLGLDVDAHVEWLRSGDAAADAEELDAFCIDVDKTMGFHLQHGTNGAFTGTKLRGLAEAQGLELAADGAFKYYDEAAEKKLSPGPLSAPLFVMFNREHYPFSPDMLRSSVVKGITFQLDIPHVNNCTEAYNHMVLVAKQMETGLNAQLVDDNGKPLGDVQIEKIRHQLKIIQAKMMARGIVPGSDIAHRLFS